MDVRVATLPAGSVQLRFDRGDAYPIDAIELAMIPQTFNAPMHPPTMLPILTGFDLTYADAHGKPADHHVRNLLVDVDLKPGGAWYEESSPSTGTYRYGVELRIRVGMRDNSPSGPAPDDPFVATISASALCIFETGSILVHP
jgi:hypothetical protein